MTSPLFSRGPTEAFPYRIDEEAGTGAMGVVYRATDVALARPVAIKVMKIDLDEKPELSGEERQRFLQEARAGAALTHPGVTTVYRIGKLKGAPYIVMEWLEGKTLQQVVQSQGPLPVDRAARYMYELLDVLAFAHGAGVVHRDIKPANLVVIEGDRIKVTDFGLAVQQGNELVRTAPGSVMATPQYASPEQLDGQRVDQRSDLFSAAVVFYHLLTASAPWEGRNLTELFTALFNKPPVPVSQRQSQLPYLLEPWFERALARNREQRFASAEQMVEALRRVLDPPSTGRQLAQTLTKTDVISAPEASFVATAARRPWEGVIEMVRSWDMQDLGIVERDGFLDKLLDKPLHAPAFAGAAFYGRYCLLVERGVVLAAVGLEDGQVDREVDLSEKERVQLFAAPASFRDGLITLVASALLGAPARHQGLDSQLVNLPAFTAKLLSRGFEGVLRLEAEGRFAIYLLLEGRPSLAVVGAGWSEDPRDVSWETWLESVEATASFFDRTVRPPSFWYRRGFRNLEIRVSQRPESSPTKGSASTLSELIRSGAHEEQRLFETRHVDPQRDAVETVPLAGAPMSRFVDWMLEALPRILVERRLAENWKYLADWLPLIRRVRLYADLERPGTGRRDFFDLVTEDEQGKALHLVRRLNSLDVTSFRAFIDAAVAAKEARTKQGDVGGVMLICPSFSEEVFEAYRSMLHRGLGNRLLGLDRSMGYDGFVRLTARRGFHLLLVEERDGEFRPRFVE